MVKTNFAAVIGGRTVYFATREAAKAAAQAAYEAKAAAQAAYLAKKAKERQEAATLGRHQVRNPHTGEWVRFQTKEDALSAQAGWKEEVEGALAQSSSLWDEVGGGWDEDPWADLREELEEERRMEKEWDQEQAAKKKKGGRRKKAE